jgi:hypothetical protein
LPMTQQVFIQVKAMAGACYMFCRSGNNICLQQAIQTCERVRIFVICMRLTDLHRQQSKAVKIVYPVHC